MIWYLLYPLRGTTEAPLLPPTHPLRSALTRYGRYAARHVLATLLISVAVAGILIYPCPFLYTTDYTVAAPNLPLHVWTDAQPVDDRPAVQPDVIMRTIWVHGSYMEALDREVLLGALELQDAILGPTTDFDPRQPTGGTPRLEPEADLTEKERNAFHVINGLTNQSWFFHSPLQYWACDAGNIARDADFINTVNEKKTQPTSVNVTLRHSIVFSGKKFEDRQLIAADALVITLLHLQDSPVGRQWGRKTAESASRMADKWDVFPRNGVSAGSQLFEFQFRPISIQDAVLLSLAYLLTTTYFLLSLSKIRAVKSKLGLIVTVVAQIIMSIISSLTVCALLRIDLSRIPRAAYPLVLMAMSLENVFRLINAVILTPSDHNTSGRIGYAFGETGHVALASVAQNLLILWGLAKVVSSGVSAFCTFAAIAILFDFFYLSTFFLSVLSVDVRRTELGDALEKASIRNNRMTLDGPPRQSIVDAILQGRIALSTRIAGTVVMLGFVIVAQWHFLESGNARSPAGLWRHLWRSTSAEDSLPYAQIHQARSPKSWLRLQDHETAKEVINVIKPWAHSYIARVHDPVVFVLKGANRNPPKGVRWFPDAVYDFTHHQITPFIVTVLVLVAMVRLLMNYLLWDEMVDVRGEDDVDEEPLVSVKSLANGHHLDIARLLVAPDSHVVSAGLDRKIRVWDLQYDFASHDLYKPGFPMDSPFPIQAMAVDSASNWLAILSTYRVLLWSISKQEWGPSAPVDLYGQKPEAFFFGPTRNNSRLSIVIVRRNGTMAEIFPDALEHSDHLICKSPLTSAVTIAEKREYSPPSSLAARTTIDTSTASLLLTNGNPHAAASVQSEPRLSIVTLSRRSCIHRVDYIDGLWISSEAKIVGGALKEPQALLPVQGFASYMVVGTHGVDLVDLYSSRILHTFQTETIRLKSLKFVYQGQRTSPGGRGTVTSLTLAYLSGEDGECVLQTYLPGEDYDNICFSDVSGARVRSSCTWGETRLVTRRILNPGAWTPLRNGCFVGIRRKEREDRGSPMRERLPVFAQSGLRRRGHADPSPRRSKLEESWEIWVISGVEKEGNIETTPLVAPDDPAGLIISTLGPMIKVGYSSAAVGFGNVIKIITVGHERFDNVDDEAAEDINLTNRRRRAPHSRPRVSSISYKQHQR